MQQIFTIASACLFIFVINFFNLHATSVNGEILPFQQFLGDVAINCGCLTNSTALDGRHWVGDGENEIQPKGNSITAISSGNLLMADPTPFFTARVSSTCFSYSFKVNSGQKFVRLHFYPNRYRGFRHSRDFFTVKANSFTLLQNFSASIVADELNVKYFVKEFCLSVNETGILQIHFSALYSNSFVFVNGIEIISLPTGLYYTPFDNQGAILVGHHNHFHYVDNSTALELVQRLNVGGGPVLPVEDDTGMFRKWSDDADYVIASSEFEQIRNLVPAITSPFLAPFKIYQTSRILKRGLQSKEKHHLTWKIPVDLGFCYLLRLHLCSCGGEIVENEDLSIVIQNVVVETRVDVIRLSGGNGIAEYRDYLVMMKGDRTEGKHDLLISLQSFDELVLCIMKGLEIFKLSNTDNSLASPNPFSPIHDSSFWSVKIRNFLVAFGRLNMIMTALTTLLVIVNAAAYQLRQICKHKFWQDEDKHVRLASNEPSCYCFSLAEILLATRNFDDALVIGKGGFGKVYKGLVSGHSEVLAIKRLKAESRQGAHEFWREIETLSKLRHIHLVPLLGYCNESEEMILVYEYMPRGTVADNIYKARINGDNGIPLTWEQRLRICIGAARGLEYLHTGTQYGIIHRDVKDTNILLDENYVAKISDFGLSKQGSITKTQDQLSTRVKGTIGYLDPHYLATHKPSITTDVYAFGVVLLVVLSGRPALEIKFPGEIVSLLACFRECVEKGELNEIIDPSIQEEISAESLTKFMEAVENCLHHLPKKRATMAQLVVNLENALEKNRASVPSTPNDDEIVVNQPLLVESNQPFEFFELQLAPILEENAPSFPVEGNTSNEIQKADLPTKAEVLLSRETAHNITKKPLWGRPWFVRKNISKKVAKMLSPKDITSATFKFSESTLKKDVKILLPKEINKSETRNFRERILNKDVEIFLLNDIKSATKNFSDELMIEKRGLYDTYKAFIGDGSRILEIKRAKPGEPRESNKARKAFKEHIEFLKYCEPHINVVSSMGYCDEDNETILVYEYTPHVNTLDEYLFRKCTNNVLSWGQRLQICRDAALGLHHLHKSHMVHKDMNICNIKLDENLVPKIFGFGCFEFERRIGRFRDTFSYLPPSFQGTLGYIDPYYAVTGMLTEASDVYSFGIVMLVVLSGIPPVNHKKEHVPALWFTECFRNGNLIDIVDPNLEGMNPFFEGLEIFVELINKCLMLVPKDRPDMAQVVADLDAALCRLAL